MQAVAKTVHTAVDSAKDVAESASEFVEEMTGITAEEAEKASGQTLEERQARMDKLRRRMVSTPDLHYSRVMWS